MEGKRKEMFLEKNVEPFFGVAGPECFQKSRENSSVNELVRRASLHRNVQHIDSHQILEDHSLAQSLACNTLM